MLKQQKQWQQSIDSSPKFLLHSGKNERKRFLIDFLISEEPGITLCDTLADRLFKLPRGLFVTRVIWRVFVGDLLLL